MSRGVIFLFEINVVLKNRLVFDVWILISTILIWNEREIKFKTQCTLQCPIWACIVAKWAFWLLNRRNWYFHYHVALKLALTKAPGLAIDGIFWENIIQTLFHFINYSVSSFTYSIFFSIFIIYFIISWFIYLSFRSIYFKFLYFNIYVFIYFIFIYLLVFYLYRPIFILIFYLYICCFFFIICLFAHSFIHDIQFELIPLHFFIFIFFFFFFFFDFLT